MSEPAGITIAFDGGPETVPSDITTESLFAWIYGDGPRPRGLSDYIATGVTMGGLNAGEAPHVRVNLARVPPTKD